MPKHFKLTTVQGFDKLAGVYDVMMHTLFLGRIKRSQTCFLHHLPKEANLLILGGGTGWIVEEIWKVRPHASIVYVELSPKMLAKTQQRIPPKKLPQIHLLLGNEESIPQHTLFDAVCTFFFLDLFTPEKALSFTKRLDASLKPKGVWLYADFEAKGKGAWLKKTFIRLMYLVCACFCKLENTTYWDYPQSFQSLSYTKKATKTFFGGLIRADCYKKLKFF